MTAYDTGRSRHRLQFLALVLSAFIRRSRNDNVLRPTITNCLSDFRRCRRQCSGAIEKGEEKNRTSIANCDNDIQRRAYTTHTHIVAKFILNIYIETIHNV